MIEQILNRDFVRDQLDDLREELRDQVSRLTKGQEPPPDHLTVDDYQEALASLNATARREERRSSGQQGFDADASERRRGVTPLDDRAFLSRDPIMSIVQSALEEYFEARRAVRRVTTTGAGRRRGEAPAVTSLTLRDAQPLNRGRRGRSSLRGRRIFNKFSILDAGWVNSKIAEGIRWFRHKAPFNGAPADPVSISDSSRLVLVGDWGSGIDRARDVATQIRVVLKEGTKRGIEQHVIHLGDVYYSGWKREYEKRFLAPWPIKPHEADRFTSWSLNGNHDMYSGGHSYYGVMLADPRFAKQQRSSFFSLSNNAWDILGLDTAYEEAELMAPQQSWVQSKVKAGRKLMLLSHHQPFSAFERCGKALSTQLGGPLSSGRVRAWFWGHEHRCAVYNPYGGVANGRCIGHGGVPVYQYRRQDGPVKKPARYEFRDYVGLIERWALFGFAVVDFVGERAHVRYIDENGTEHYQEDID